VERIPIRYDRAVKAEWLDYALEQAVVAQNASSCRSALKVYLEPRVKGTEAKIKTVTQLMRVVGTASPIPRERLEALHAEMVKSSPDQRNHLRLQLLVEASPFFSDCVTSIRKLSVLGQEGIGISQLYERLIALYGDRAIVPRSVENVLTTLLWMGLVRNCDRRWIASETLLTKN
jgi:hypothetical protein